MRKYIAIVLIASLSFLCLASCNDGTDGMNFCSGMDFNDVECLSQFLINSGHRGLTCLKCTSDHRDEEFSLSFNPSLDPSERSPIGTQFMYPGGTFIPEFSDCTTMTLFELSEQVGSIIDIDPILPDELALTVDLEGADPEGIICGFCFIGPKPPCAP